jgi:DNA polymerase I-like protein with 3'-5' exonuclease and polymerase domains
MVSSAILYLGFHPKVKILSENSNSTYKSLLSSYKNNERLEYSSIAVANNNQAHAGIKHVVKGIPILEYHCISDKVCQLQKELDAYAPGVNWRSPPQVAKLMFSPVSDGGLGLKPSVLTKTGKPSTGDEVLKSLSGKHPLIDLKIKYNKYAKLQSAFIQGWEKYIVPSGRMYPSYEITGTVTGRLSCSKPNLQQVPRTKAIRSLITAPDGYTLVSGDFSQIELRLAAMVAKEQTMLKIFNTPSGDIHTETAKIITGKETITKDDRTKAKGVNFASYTEWGLKRSKHIHLQIMV